MKKAEINLFKRSKIKVFPALLIVLGVFAVLFVLLDSWWVLLPIALIVAVIIIRRLFFTPVKFEDGDVAYLYGGPGTGKTLAMTRIALDNCGDRLIVANEEYSHCDLADAVISSSDIGYYDFSMPALICNDESMLDGFGARDYQTNFSDPAKTEFIVKIRQYGHAMVFTSQRQDALDVMLREGIINRWYVCSCVIPGKLYLAEMLIKDYAISEISGLPQVYYRFPTFMEWLKDPSLRLYNIAPLVGKHYSTHNPKKLPIYHFIDYDSM